MRRVAALLLVVALAACSGAPGGGGPTPSPPSDSSQGREFQEPGPLEVYFDTGYDLTSPRDFAASHLEREEAIAACMAKQGFDYVPSTIQEGSVVVGDGPPRGTRGFAETYGYGVWEGPENEPGQVNAMIDDSANAAYLNSLSPTARQAYDVALNGQMTVEGDAMTFDGTGCSGANGVGAGAAEDAFLAGVVEEAVAFLESLQQGTDARLAEVDAAWASCMTDAGYRDASPAAAEARVAEEASEYFAANSSSVDAELMAERAAEERRLALADMDCREEADWAARRRAAEIELQQEYVEAHREDLEALVEASAAG